MKWYFIPCFFVGLLQATTQVRWESDGSALNLQSDGSTPLNGDFQFYLGSFERGFTPTVQNLTEWPSRFVPVDDSEPGIYDVGRSAFVKDANLPSNDPPFSPTMDKVYIWGRNGLASGSEWILMTRSLEDWKWPTVSGIPTPNGPVYLVNSVEPVNVIIGAANQGGVQMQTARVVFEESYQDWVATNFQAGEASERTDDPDGDGRENILEYAVGSDPKQPDSVPFFTFESSGLLNIRRIPGRRVTWGVETGVTLQDFAPLTSGITIIQDIPENLIYQLPTPFAGRRFFRVTVQ